MTIFLGDSLYVFPIQTVLIVCPTQLYDHDKDGILNFKESQKVLRCLGLRVSEDQAKILIKKVSADRFGFSVSFNEYLRLVSIQRRREPDEECLLGTSRPAQWASFNNKRLMITLFLSLRHCPAVIVCPHRDIQVNINITNINYVVEGSC